MSVAFPVTVEPAAADFSGWGALLTLLQTSFAYMDGRIDPPSSLQGMTVADLQAKAQRERLIVAHENGRLVGCVYADVRNHCVYVGKLAVEEQARGRGIARQLLEQADAVARAAGRPLLELQTRVELVENHASFAALGFKKTAESAHAGYRGPTSITMQRPVQTRTLL